MASSNKKLVVNGTDHWITREGHRIHVWRKSSDKSASDNNVTLLVHGGTYSGQTDFDVQVGGENFSLMDHLVGLGHDVFTLAVWGYGKSDRPTDGFQVTTQSAVEDTTAVVEAIRQIRNVDKVNIVGWSWGGRISSIYASKNPSKVRRLVLYAGGAGQRSDAAVSRPEESWRTITRESIVSRIEQDVVVPEAQEAFIEASLTWDVKAPNGTQLEGIDAEHPSVAVPEDILTPTLIIYGSRDPAYDGHRVSDYFARLNTQDKELVVMPDSGHFLFLQKPKNRFFNVVGEFLHQD